MLISGFSPVLDTDKLENVQFPDMQGPSNSCKIVLAPFLPRSTGPASADPHMIHAGTIVAV